MTNDSEAHWNWMNDPRNLTIALLMVAVLLLGGTVLAQRLPSLFDMAADEPDGEAVSILDVVLDRDGLSHLDVLFDRPLGEDAIGDILADDPATIRPVTGGSWRWQGANVLRFEPTGGFRMAMEYEVSLVAERVLGEGQVLRGETGFTVRTDQFQVERIDVVEEPRLEGENEVVLRGNVRFNYAVDPEVLATRMRLIDPDRGDGDPVELGIETYWANKVIGFRSDPLRKQSAARELRLVIQRELTPDEGNVPLPEEFVHVIALGSSDVLAVQQVTAEAGEPDSRLRIRLSSAVNAEVAAPFVEVTPAVDYRVRAQGNELVLEGAFIPGAAYQLHVEAGLPGTDSATLPEEAAYGLRVPDLEPVLDFRGDGMFLSALGARSLAVDSVNVGRAELVVDRVYRNNLFYLLQSYGYSVWTDEDYSGSGIAHSLGDRIAQETLAFGGSRNSRQTLPLRLDRYIAGAGPGMYRVAVSRPGSWRAAQRWILITDLGIVAKRSAREILVWVSSFADLGPISGANVTLLSNQNQVIARGRTDSRGVWHARNLGPRLRDASPYLVLVERGSDFSFLALDSMRIDTSGLDVGGARAGADGYDAFLYGERDIYRPGETVEGVAVVRTASLQPPPAMPLVLRHRDPQGIEAGEYRVESDRDGLAGFDIDVPVYARTGVHTLDLIAAERVIGSYRFQVEEFVPDRIRVEIGTPVRATGPGEMLEFEVASSYLFGPPAAGLSVEGSVRLEAREFRPAGLEAFSFINEERGFERQDIFTSRDRLDEAGRIGLGVEVPEGLRVPSSLRAVITARVQEEGGRSVAAREAVPVHPYPHYVGVRRDGAGYADPGAAQEFEYVAVRPDGSRVPSGSLRADLFRDEWNTVLRRAASGSFRYETTRQPRRVDSLVIAGGQSSGTFSFTPPEFGAYRVVVSDPDTGASAQVAFTASGWGYSPWAIENPARVDIELDRDEYSPGDTATVQIRAPFAGRMLLTVERENIHETRIVDLDGNTATIELPIRDAYRPNTYVTATLVREVSTLHDGAVGRAFGAVPLYVDRGANRIPLRIEAPEEMRPGNPLRIRIDGTAGAAMTVAAVDEGILQLIGQQTPDPFTYFYKKLALGVAGADTFSLLLPEVPVEAAAVGGGAAGDGRAQYVGSEGMRRVRPVALWSGVVRADSSGVVEVEFDVPEFQGALRIMAVAYSGRRFGSADGATRVRDPLVLLPTFPRFLAFGDRVQVPVTVRNDTGESGTFDVRITADGPARVDGAEAQAVSVSSGDSTTIYFDVVAGDEPGPVHLRLTASGHGESTQAEVELPVRADLPRSITDVTGSLVSESTTLAAVDGAAYRPGTVGRTLRIARFPMVQFAGRLEYVLRYPYGCLEQVTSAVFPLVYLDEVARELAPTLFDEYEPAAMVDEGIRRLATLQHFTGGFSLWPRGDEVEPWASIYATHFLVEAQRAGHLVPGTMLDRALEWVSGEVRAQQEYSAGQLERAAYSLYVLARAGAADVGTMDFVRQRHAGALRPQSRALLGAAYAAIGDVQAAEDLIRDLAEAEQIRRQTGGNFDSTVRNRALVLMALLDASPDDPRIAGLVQRLGRDGAAMDPWNTQETAFVLLALGQFYRRQSAGPSYAGQVFVGDERVDGFADGPVEISLPGTGPVRIDMAPGYSSGGAFFSLRTTGIPADAAFRAEQRGLEISRSFLSRDGSPLPPTDLQQGDLVVVRTRVRSTEGPVENVVVQMLLPAGFEVENARLTSRESLPWIGDANLQTRYLDVRDDRVLQFLDLPDTEWRTGYVLLRVVAPGRFRLPPLAVEAMYEPSLRATTSRGEVEVRARQ